MVLFNLVQSCLPRQAKITTVLGTANVKFYITNRKYLRNGFKLLVYNIIHEICLEFVVEFKRETVLRFHLN